MQTKLEELANKYEMLSSQLQMPGIADDQKKYRELMKQLSDLEKIVTPYREYKKFLDQKKESLELIDEEQDKELIAMAREDLAAADKQLPNLEKELKILLLPTDPNDDKNVILEIRAGAGGDEAALFAEELFDAYKHFANKNKWQLNLISLTDGNAGGVKEVIATISGEKVYSIMKFESGVHRVQRVPKTETQGRVHTSTITVAVIPEVEEVNIQVKQSDLRIDVYRSSGKGGQSVNTTDSAVRVTHLPTGLIVTCQDGKSQLSNKESALKVLASRLQALEDEKNRQEASDQRLSQIGTGDRSERIRTYNFPQTRVTDHRIGLTLHRINEIMSGELECVIDPLITHYQAEALKNQSNEH